MLSMNEQCYWNSFSSHIYNKMISVHRFVWFVIFFFFLEVTMCRRDVSLNFSCGRCSWCSTLREHTWSLDTDFKLYASCDQNPWLGKSMVQDARNVPLCCKMNTVWMHNRFCWCSYTGRILKSVNIIGQPVNHTFEYFEYFLLSLYFYSSSAVTSVVSKP